MDFRPYGAFLWSQAGWKIPSAERYIIKISGSICRHILREGRYPKLKFKVDKYEVYNRGRTFTILKFPRTENAWAFDDVPEEDQLMLDGCPEFMQHVQHSLAALIENPNLIIYFPIKHPDEKTYRPNPMTYDAVILRPELQFRRSDWLTLRRKLDQKHWKGKYTICHDVKKLDDWYKKRYAEKHWLYLQLDKRKTEEIRDETVFLVLPRELMYIYHCRITDGLKYFNPEKDEYGYPVGIGYIMPNMYPVNSES